MQEQYCLYLRKSRSDAEAEARGEGETLARHEKALLDLAKKLNLNITEIYREVVSGETIAARPVMQHLLQEVEQGIWKGVLVMEVERLARGDTIDQGIVAQTFKFSDTKIITPIKTYNPNNEFDEEYFEFGLFMSRREYKTINRRLQRGRLASVKEGKYVSNKAPYGYKRIPLQNDKGWTLEIAEDEADVIRLIFELYTTGKQQADGTYKRLGTSLIAQHLNALKVPTKTGTDWSVATIRDILINPVYIGIIRWNWRPAKKKMIDGQLVTSRPRAKQEDCIYSKGLHQPIISEETFNLAQEYINSNPPRPIGEKNTVKNPLSGIVICGKCGRHMVRRPYYKREYPDTLMCAATSCNNVSSQLNIVEKRILEALEEWLDGYKLQWDIENTHNEYISQSEIKRKALKKNQTELDTLYKQLDRTHDLLEQNIYDTDMFLERSRAVSQRINETKSIISTLEQELQTELAREENIECIIPKVEKLLEVYHELPTPKAKNDMLKEVLEKIVYTKNNRNKRNGPVDEFDITIFPKIPKYIKP
ncbi:recombinase family protein [Lachnospiraceae bacterium MD329]|nr:recombinase family protein [Lachnospiraceae bacterium MD329]